MKFKSIYAIGLAVLACLAAAVGFGQQAQQPRGINSLRDRLNQRRTATNAAAVQNAAPRAPAPAPTGAASEAGKGGTSDLNFNQTPIDLVFETYSRMKGKTILKDPQVPNANITLKSESGQKLTEEEQLEAIEIILEMNGVHLEPYGESFIRALPRKDARKEGIPLIMDAEAKLRESGRVVSMMITFKNIGTDEAQKALEGFKSNSGILLVFERTNSILVTDTEQNINRMLEITKAIDIASPVTEVVEYVQINYASATEVKSVLDAIVQESQKEQEKNGKNNNAPQPQARPAMSRLLGRNQQQNQQQEPVNNASLVMSVSDADRGMIRGKVVTIADERSNKILLITSPTNMRFFKEVIAALDVETTPDTVVKVYRLKYAEAEDVSDMINDLIGNSVSGKDSKGNQNQNAKSGVSGSVTRGNQQAAKKPANQRSGDAKAGELNKENTTVLADKRINGLVVMTNKELVPTVEQIIESMDIKLSQVLIETAIIEVTLGDDYNTGVDWVRYNKETGTSMSRQSGDGYAIGGGGGGAAETLSSIMWNVGTAAVENAYFNPAGSGLNYFLKSDKLNLAAIVQASKSDSHSKYIASPIIMTVDNKEATINATDMTYLLKGFTSSGNSYSTIAVPDYEQKELGIEIKTTPKINPNGTVMLTVETKYTQKAADQTIKYATGTSNDKSNSSLQDVSVPTTTTREMSADVLLENMQTVILGGLTDTYGKDSDSGIPILKDIPLIGKWLFGKVVHEEKRKELLIFMTPYVLDDSVSAQAEAIRRKKVLSDSRPWDDHGWSLSELADPVSKREQLRRIKDEWKVQDEERKTRIAIEQEKVDRAKMLQDMSEEERNLWLKMHKEELDEEQQEELEKKMLDKDSQDMLRDLADEIRAKKLKEANKEIKKMEEATAADNERAKLDAAKKEAAKPADSED